MEPKVGGSGGFHHDPPVISVHTPPTAYIPMNAIVAMGLPFRYPSRIHSIMSTDKTLNLSV